MYYYLSSSKPRSMARHSEDKKERRTSIAAALMRCHADMLESMGWQVVARTFVTVDPAKRIPTSREDSYWYMDGVGCSA